MSPKSPDALRHLRRLLVAPHAPEVADADLVQRFVLRRDEAAFELLMWRHGGMVMGVCRAILRHTQDAEDAFQATFLALARKAGSIGRRQAVAGWLHRVARNAALKARMRHQRDAARPLEHEPVAPPPPAQDELAPLLHEELGRLPDKYRLPLVLCFLEGRSHADAARRLRWPRGTVAGRIARAREVLRRRLARRGVVLTAAGFATALTPAASPAVPPALVSATVRASLAFVSGDAAAVSAPVLRLAEGVFRAMFLSKVKSVALALCLLGCVVLGGLGTLALAQQTGGPAKAPPNAEAPKAGGVKVALKLKEQGLDADTVAAYEKLGGTYGGMGPWFKPGKEAAETELPAFCFPGDLPAPLPDPGVPFGLHVGYYAMNRPAAEWVPKNAGTTGTLSDAGLKNLNGLKSLDTLYLYSFSTTNAGMKELAGLKKLRKLDLIVPLGVSDAGLKELAGLDNLAELSLTANDVTDAGLKELARIKNLSSLSLMVPRVSDAGLKELAPLKGLRTLALMHAAGVTDAGMKELAALKNLSTLSLFFIGLTDAGLKDVGALTNLSALSLRCTKITDGGLKELAGLGRLTELDLSGTPVTDAGLKSLEPLDKLTSLDLSLTQVSDAGLRALTALPRLTALDLSNTTVSDAGLKELAELKQLSSLRLYHAGVTDAGVALLQKRLPNCKIER
jgi:RNA polymerase sigma factor (sigma-70 family)